MTMLQLVRALRREGWRVRRGGWPATLVGEARWDFCRPHGHALYPMTPAASQAVERILEGGKDA